jgi:excisionase family DNA binding protein
MKKRTKPDSVARTSSDVQPEYFDPVDAASFILHCRSWLDKLKNKGDIPYYKVGNRVLFRRADLIAYMEKFRVDPTVPAAHETSHRPRSKNGYFESGGGE